MMAGAKVEFDMASNAGARKAENLIKLNRLDYVLKRGWLSFLLSLFCFNTRSKSRLGPG